MRDKYNGLLNVNIGFESFLRVVNGCVHLRHDFCSKA